MWWEVMPPVRCDRLARIAGALVGLAACREPNPAYIEAEDAAAEDVAPSPADAAAGADRPLSVDAPVDASAVEVAPREVAPLDGSAVEAAPPDRSAVEAAPPDRVAPDGPPPDAPGTGLARGLIGYWRFDDGAGTRALDSSGQGNHGTLLGMDDRSWVAGRIRGALRFDGATQWVRVPASPSLDAPRTTRALTVAAWVSRASGGYMFQGVVSRQYRGTVFEHFALFADSRGFVGTVNYQPGYTGTCQGPAVPFGQWTHLAVTASERGVQGYVNGAQVCTLAAAPALAADTTPVAIGANSDRPAVERDQLFSGLIDEVVLYDRALSAAEVRELAAGRGPLVP